MSAEAVAIIELLNATLNPQQHRAAETQLRQAEKNPNYAIILLQIVEGAGQALQTRLAAALAFKNFMRLNYVNEDGTYKLPEAVVGAIKRDIVGLMIASPPSIQAQLGDAISIIADSDFWQRWDTLTSDLVKRLSDSDFKVTNGVLEVAHSIFGRWRPLFQSNELYTEINHVINIFGEPFVKMLAIVDSKIEASTSNKADLIGWLQTMSLLIKILFDLSCHDMPPVVESNLKPITSIMIKYLSYRNPIFDSEEDEATIVETVKSDICEVVQLYTEKFDEDFRSSVQNFANVAWGVLSNVGAQKRYDTLVCKALQFLTTVASVPRHAQNFQGEEILGTIVDKIILPSVTLRMSDVEMFEDEPIEFIRRDLEGSDTDSRRRAASDFLRKLLDNSEELVTGVVSKYINYYLNEAKTKNDWKAKDTAVYLFLAIAAKGAVTAAQGVKTVNRYVNVVQFFQDHIAADLVGDSVQPISKVDAIKYLHNFRSQLNKEQWTAALPPLIQNMASQNYVVYTYAAIAVERVLFLTDDNGKHLFVRDDIAPFAKDLLEHLFALIEKDTSPAKLQENEFLMRCIMRVLIVLKSGAEPILDGVLTHLINITGVIKTNPSNPRFYYYHFEAIGALVRYCGDAPEEKLFGRLWEPFNSILDEDVSEFVSYVYQITSYLLENKPESPLPPIMQGLVQRTLISSDWETRGNVPPLARFVAAIIPRAKQEILANRQLQSFLAIFQHLLKSKKTEQSSFDILDAIVGVFEGQVLLRSSLDEFFQVILTLLFEKVQAQDSDSFKIRLVRFYHLVSSRTGNAGLGADYFCRHSEAIAQGTFTAFYLNVVLKVTAQLARPVDRKVGVISYTKTLCESTAFAERYAKGWGFTCEKLLELLKNAPEVPDGLGDEILTEADVDDIGFGVGFTPLTTCKRASRDDYPEIVDINTWVREYMIAANQRTGGQVVKFASERLSDQAKSLIQPYLA